jgi:CRISPR/Cas system-associated exonuclease Cas4 (RecB family)
MSTHAPISASRLDRIILCPGSYLLEQGLPNPTNEAAQRGTDIHAMAQDIWDNKPIECDDPEMLQVATDYVDYLKQASTNAKMIKLEWNLTPMLSKLHPDLGGTADAVFVIDNALHVVDLKTGRVKVSPEHNNQLLMYALGAVMMCIKADIRVTHIYLHIFQPFNKTQPVYVSLEDIEKFEEELVIIAKMANEPTAPRFAGNKQCRYCRAKSICPTLKETAIKSAQIDFRAEQDNMADLLNKAELCKSWAESVQILAKVKLEAGASIDGWSLQAGRKMQKWDPMIDLATEFRNEPNAWELKSPAAMIKAKIPIPVGAIITTHSAPSLTRIKE